MEQTLLWPSHMMSLVKTDRQMEAVSASLNAFLLLKSISLLVVVSAPTFSSPFSKIVLIEIRKPALIH